MSKIIPAIAAIVALAAVAACGGGGSPPSTFREAETQVAELIAASDELPAGVSSVEVTCTGNTNPALIPGRTFGCFVTVWVAGDEVASVAFPENYKTVCNPRGDCTFLADVTCEEGESECRWKVYWNEESYGAGTGPADSYPAAADGWQASQIQQFVDTCYENRGKRSYCSCVLDTIKSDFTAEDIAPKDGGVIAASFTWGVTEGEDPETSAAQLFEGYTGDLSLEAQDGMANAVLECWEETEFLEEP